MDRATIAHGSGAFTYCVSCCGCRKPFATPQSLASHWVHCRGAAAERASNAPQVDALTAVAPEAITSGEDLFRCEPYGCVMLARRCVERQAKAELGIDAIGLLKCRGCELGARVKAHAAVVVDEQALIQVGRGRNMNRSGARGQKFRGARVNPNPTPEFQAAVAAPPRPPSPPKPAVAAAPPIEPVHVAQPPEKEAELEAELEAANLQGKTIGGCQILGRAPSVDKNTRWSVRHVPCGHEEIVPHSSLLYCVQRGSVRKCTQCRDEQQGAAAVPGVHLPPAPKPRARTADTTAAPAYEFPLRRDFLVKVALPRDLTAADVRRLSRWLELLVFDAEDTE